MGRFVATIFVIRFSPQKIVGKIVWKNCLENFVGKLDGKLVGNVGWKCWVGKMCWKCWVEMFGWKCWLENMLEKMLVNGCEIIGGKSWERTYPQGHCLLLYMK